MATPRTRSTRRSGSRTRPIPPALPAGMPVGEVVVESPAPGILGRRFELPGVSLEAAAYALVLGVSLALRLWRLDDMPLGPDEARVAAAAIGAPGSSLPSETGALLGFGTSLVLALAGTTDAAARFLPTIVGGLIPLAARWLRQPLGTGPALIAAALLALSPLLMDRGRALDSAAIGATLSLALVGALFAYARTRRRGWLRWSAVLLALTLVAGTAAISALAALALFVLWMLVGHARSRGLPRDMDEVAVAVAPANGHATEAAIPEVVEARGEDVRSPRRQVGGAIALFVGTLLIVATSALTNIGGIGAGVFAPLGSWLRAAAPITGGTPYWLGPLTYVTYEPLVAILGMIGAVLVLRRGDALGRLLVWWMALGLLVAFSAPALAPSLLATAVVPATLLAALLIHHLLLRVLVGAASSYLVALMVIVWGTGLMLLALGHLSQPNPIALEYVTPVVRGLTGPDGAEDAARWTIVLVPLLLLLGGILRVRRWLGSTAGSALGLAAATVLLGFSVHAGWNLAYNAVGNTAEVPRTRQTSVDARTLHRDADITRQALAVNRKDTTLVADVGLRDPLAWYLRRDGTRWHTRTAVTRFEANPAEGPAMLVLPADAATPRRYTGQRYQVTLQSELRFETLAAFWRWLMYRESPVPASFQDVVLFVRQQS